MSQKRQVLHYVLAYICWAISTLFGVLILNLERETLLMAMTVSGTSLADESDAFYQSLRAGTVAQWSWLVIGIIAIALLVGFEHMYRNSVPAGTLWKLFFLVTAVEATILFLIHTIYMTLVRNFRPVGTWSIAILVGEALIAVAFWWLYSTRKEVEPVHE